MRRSYRQMARTLWLLTLVGMTPAIGASTPEFVIEIRNHLFEPDVVRIPADTKVKLVIFNRDDTPEEFESYELNREKVIMGGRKAIVFIGPLSAGEYPFFGEFNPQTALGTIIVEENSGAAE
jgi:hypothetical protein